MSFTFLGTGTSQGVPVIGCDCPVCTSDNPRDNRLRTAALISQADTHIAIDAGPDFRQQMLRAKINDLEAILFTHAHSDHTAGLDDVRPINFRHQKFMPLYATSSVQADLRQRFAYAFDEDPYPGAPRLSFQTISKEETFEIKGIKFQPIEISHGGDTKVLGFRIGQLTYITDCKSIDSTEFEKIKGSQFLIINALHHNEHPSHLNLAQALAIVADAKPEQAFFTHISHNMGLYHLVNGRLPPHVSLAYDGLRFEFE